jgi:hypothetical protein
MSQSKFRSEVISTQLSADSGSDRDGELICPMAAGDEAALKEIHWRHTRRIRSFAPEQLTF